MPEDGVITTPWRLEAQCISLSHPNTLPAHPPALASPPTPAKAVAYTSINPLSLLLVLAQLLAEGMPGSQGAHFKGKVNLL